MPLEIWLTLGILPFAFWAGRVHRRVHGPAKMKTQVKRLLIMCAVLMMALLTAAAFADAPKPPPIASALRSGSWRYSAKEIALPQGQLCFTHAEIWRGRHVTLKVAGAQMFEATLAIVRPQHKRGNIISIFVDNEEVDSVQISYSQNPHTLRIPLPPDAQTLTLVEQRNFPSVLICNPRLS
jgi:hypothetical protein